MKSPVFSEVVIFYRDFDFPNIAAPWSDRTTYYLSRADTVEEATRHSMQFQVFRMMHGLQPFQLVLCADVWDGAGAYSVRVLKELVRKETGRWGSSRGLPTEVAYSPRGSRQQRAESLDGPLNPWISL